jgi:hypothetical protein
MPDKCQRMEMPYLRRQSRLVPKLELFNKLQELLKLFGLALETLALLCQPAESRDKVKCGVWEVRSDQAASGC